MIGAQDMNSLDFNVILPLEYDNAIHFGRDFLLVTKENKTTVYNLVKRKLVTTKTYKSISGDFVYSHSSLILFWVTNEKGDKFLLGENGVEFYASN